MKSVLVTGYATNIGKSIALRFYHEGYHIIGVHGPNSKAKSEELLANYPEMEAFEADFCSNTSVDALLDALKNCRFDVVVNNAATISVANDGRIRNEFKEFDYKSFSAVMRCNFDAAVRICLELKQNINEGGSIINISSGGGMRASYASLSYAASKAALINFTQSISNSFYPTNRIRVNCVSPGWVDVEEASLMGSDKNSPGGKAARLIALGRSARAQEIANVVYFLTTEEASYINGSNIIVDGGWLNHNVIYYEEATGESLLSDSLCKKEE